MILDIVLGVLVAWMVIMTILFVVHTIRSVRTPVGPPMIDPEEEKAWLQAVRQTDKTRALLEKWNKGE